MDGKYPGITVRGNSLQFSFTYKGKRQRETVRTGRPPTNQDIKRAWKMRCAMLHDIDTGRFEYAKYFPESTRTLQFTDSGKTISVEDALNAWVKDNERNWAYSTKKDYISIINTHLLPNFGHLKLSELNKEHVDGWIRMLTISHKRINNSLIPLRMIFKEAFLAGHIDKNVMERVKHLKSIPRTPKPFTNSETLAILSALSGQCRNIIQFGFYTGLRTSELIALGWADVDLAEGRIHISKAKVRGRIKEPKTEAGRRIVHLESEAIAALISQRDLNKESEVVFLDPKHNEPWQSDQPLRKRVWIPALKTAKVDYREQYQMRHTYASRLLSNGKNPLWVATQMGHADWGMIRKVYGRWIHG